MKKPFWLCLLLASSWAQQPPPAHVDPTPEQSALIAAKVQQLDGLVAKLKGDPDLITDVAVYQKTGHQMREFPEEYFVAEDVPKAIAVLDQGIERANALLAGNAPWMKSPGRRIHGYRSSLDGSIQPYGLRIPASYDGTKPVKLYVWLHGRDAKNAEWNFIDRELRVGNAPPSPPDEGQIQLDLYGRWNGIAWHWAGEVDVFEAMADVQRRYKIDPKRIVLRGFSMGGCGAWHIALHHPGRFAAAEIGAGTWPYRSQMPGFPDYQRLPLNIYENILEWSLNAYNFPLAGHDGENETGVSSIPPYAPPGTKTRGQLESSIRVREQLGREGYESVGDPYDLAAKGTEAVFYISKDTGHGTSKEVRGKLDEFLKKYGDRGVVSPDHLRFVSWTTRYNRSHWVTFDWLDKHYEKAEIDAVRSNNGTHYEMKTKNLARLTLREMDKAKELQIDGQNVRLKPGSEISLEKLEGKWRVAGKAQGLHKQHALQGPIDDAFLDAFLLVRPTGTPWNQEVHEQSLRILTRFDRVYAKHLRAHPRIKEDRDVTEADFAKYNVVLFGDPGSNRWIAKLQGKLPVEWSKETVKMSGQSYSAKDHLPALIYPSPLHPSHYIVLNSGMTSEEKELRGEYAMPRLGDWAVLKVKAGDETPDIATAGLFNERWK
ncbi:alpha/beta hydrolase-fold protein [Bryobacter aggregatus]|uniref:alpha/beta hydrolase-fold protein n=1 Tax=Bryobacter aggregatus TaxID=360054 RepID=UPI0004E278F1|nr:alpha/beta hydrolase-fold protein [Bryobacter aggregatus]